MRKILGADTELKGNAWRHIGELEYSVLGCRNRGSVILSNFSKDDCCIRDDIAAGIGDGANDDCIAVCQLSDLTQGGEAKN